MYIAIAPDALPARRELSIDDQLIMFNRGLLLVIFSVVVTAKAIL